jgi:hypothetical protein
MLQRAHKALNKVHSDLAKVRDAAVKHPEHLSCRETRAARASVERFRDRLKGGLERRREFPSAAWLEEKKAVYA